MADHDPLRGTEPGRLGRPRQVGHQQDVPAVGIEGGAQVGALARPLKLVKQGMDSEEIHRRFLAELQQVGYEGYVVSEYCLPCVKDHRIAGVEEIDEMPKP